MQKLMFVWVLLLSLSGCKEERIDLASSTHFDIREILLSGNCKARCGERASCEGVFVRLKGFADPKNLNIAERQFFLLDAGDPEFRLEVRVHDSITAEVFKGLTHWEGKEVDVSGFLEGYDAPSNFLCKRRFVLYLNNTLHLNVHK